MDETEDPKPHPGVHETLKTREGAPGSPAEKAGRKELSIWFFCGMLMLSYGIVLVSTGVYEHFGHEPHTVLAKLQPTLWWGLCLLLFGAFYTVRFRPGKG